MGLIDRLMAPELSASTPGPTHDFWYQPVAGQMAASGQRVDTDTARKLSAWYRGREILATSLAMFPFQVMERLPNEDGSEVARDHPLYDIIHDQPNSWQDAFTWRRQMMYHLIDHGNAYCEIVPGLRGFVDELWPIKDPTTVTPKQNKVTKRIVYHIRQADGTSKAYAQEDIFHLRGASDDGIVGKGILQYARESLGLGQATESYASRLFSQGALHGGTITVPGLLNDEASKRMAASFISTEQNWHRPKVLEQGATYADSKLTPEGAQMLLSRKHTIDDIARWTGVPRMMLENSDPSFGNADQFSLNFIKFTMGGWLCVWEFGCNSQLILNTRRFFVQINRDAIERADLATRSEAYERSVNTGWETVNEVRRRENRRRIPGEADKLRVPQNITGKPAVASEPDEAPAKAAPVSAPRGERTTAEAITFASAERVLRKETLELSKIFGRYDSPQIGHTEPERDAAITTFYGKHHALVMSALLLSESAARGYCALQLSEALAGGMAAVSLWTPDYLASLALAPESASALLRAAIERPVQITTAAGTEVHQHAHAHTIVPDPVPVVTKVERAVVRGDRGVIIGVIEAHTDSAGGKRTIKKQLTRDAKGRITGVVEEYGAA